MKHKLTYMLAVVVALVGALWGSGIVPAFAQATTVTISADIRDTQLGVLNPATDIAVGDTFLVYINCNDSVGSQPVFSCYANHSFDPSIVQVETINYGANFPNFRGAKQGENDLTNVWDNTAGTIITAGAVNNITPDTSRTVYVVRFQAIAEGTFDLTTTIPDTTTYPFAETTIYNNSSEEDDQRDGGNVNIAAPSVSFTIQPPPPLSVASTNPNEGGTLSPADEVVINFNVPIELAENATSPGAEDGFNLFDTSGASAQFVAFLNPDSRTAATNIEYVRQVDEDTIALDLSKFVNMGTSYRLRIGSNVIIDANDSGVTLPAFILNFSTVAGQELAVASTDPSQGQTVTPLDLTDVRINYNQAVSLVTEAPGALTQENGFLIYDFNGPANVNNGFRFVAFLQAGSRFVRQFDSDTITIDMSNFANPGSRYVVRVGNQMVRSNQGDTLNNGYLFRFETSAGRSLTIDRVVPSPGSVNVATNARYTIAYNQSIDLLPTVSSPTDENGVLLYDFGGDPNVNNGLRFLAFFQSGSPFITKTAANTAQVNLSSFLQPGQTYVVRVGKQVAVATTGNDVLNNGFVSRFNTGSGSTTLASNERTREESSAFSLQASASTVIEESQRQSSGDAASTGALTLPAVASEFETVGPWTADESGWTIAGVEDTAALTWTQPVDLSGATSPALTFDGTLATTRSSAAVQVSTGDDAWSTVAVLQPGAGEQSIDLSSFVGSAVNVRFVWVGYGGEDTWTVSGVSIAEAPVTEEAPVEEVATEEAPAEEAPVEEVVTEEAPVEEVATEEAPAEEVVTEEAPVEEAPVEEAPAEETATEEVEAIEMDAPVSEGSFE